MVMHHLKYSCKKGKKHHFSKPTSENQNGCSRLAPASVAVLFGGDGDQLLGGFGNVVGTLDHLLRYQLNVGCGAGVGGQRLLAL